jgi:hypothetical protein
VFRDVLYVPGLKKNLISVSSIHDRGFEVSFRGTEVLIHPKGSSITSGRVIGTREGNLYNYFFSHYMLWLVATAAVSCVSYGIRGWLICIMEL